MIIVKCINDVKTELEVVDLELQRTGNNNPELISKKEELVSYLEKYQNALKNMNDLESRIYCKIVFDGLNPMKAIEKVAEENYLKDIKPSTPLHIYQKYFPKVRKFL